ncbi:putative ribonuclease H-like domain-containing protein [Tanacetum coccineum]
MKNIMQVHYHKKEEISQDCSIVMPNLEIASYFDSPSKDIGNGEPKSAADDQKQVKDGPDNENDEKDKSEDDSSPKEVNAAGQHVNTASPEVNTGHFKLNTVDPSVSTASSNDQDSPKDMFKLGASHTLEATHVEFYSDEDEPEVDLGTFFHSYTVWILVDLPIGKRAIGTKWVFRNKKDERGIVIRNKTRIEAIRLFLAYASFMGFLVYQMDVKSAFLYGTIEEEVYVTQPPGFKDPDHPDKVYKVVKALYGLHQAPRAWYETLANYLLGNGLQVQQKEDGIFISQDKYVDKILKKFNYTDVKSASTPVDLEKPLVKDGDANDVDLFKWHLPLYRKTLDLMPAYGSFDVIIGIGYASILASEQRAELFDRIGTLQRDNMRLRGMLGVERQRVDRLQRSMSYAQSGL